MLVGGWLDRAAAPANAAGAIVASRPMCSDYAPEVLALMQGSLA